MTSSYLTSCTTWVDWSSIVNRRIIFTKRRSYTKTQEVTRKKRRYDYLCVYIYIVYIYIYGSDLSSILGLEAFKRNAVFHSFHGGSQMSSVCLQAFINLDAKTHFGWYLFLSTSRSTFLLSFEWNLGSHMSAHVTFHLRKNFIIPNG